MTAPETALPGTKTSPAALEFESVSVTYGGSAGPSIRDVTLRIGQGERVALLGNNGSGKTTLLHAAAGLVPFTGTIRVGGAALDASTKDGIRARFGFLFSNPEDQILLPRVLDDVALGLSRIRESTGEHEQRAREVLRRLDSGHLAERSPHQLSQGERLRVALAGALVANPPLLLLDEPSENLDPPGKRRLASLLVQTGAAILLATHDLRFARRCCARVVILDAGSVSREASSTSHLLDEWDY
jgi:cobalt/nickel transport system ATP-binding protein